MAAEPRSSPNLITTIEVRSVLTARAPSINRCLKAVAQLREAGIQTVASVAPRLPCTPAGLAALLVPCFDSAWVNTMNFYDKADPLPTLYAERGWEKYLHLAHKENVRAALDRVGLLAP